MQSAMGTRRRRAAANIWGGFSVGYVVSSDEWHFFGIFKFFEQAFGLLLATGGGDCPLDATTSEIFQQFVRAGKRFGMRIDF